MRMVLLSFGRVATNEVAEVSVIEASVDVWSCPCTHGCVLTTRKVTCERRSANCRVVIGSAASTRVINLERKITNSGVRSASAYF